MNIADHLVTRPMETEDLHFVVASWLKSYQKSYYAGVIPNDKYHEYYKETFDQLLQRGMRVLVLCNRANSNQLVGFIAWENSGTNPVVHYIYVKDVFRRKGISKFLMQSAGVTSPYYYTFRTYASRHLSGGRYKPALARRKNLEPVYEITD